MNQFLSEKIVMGKSHRYVTTMTQSVRMNEAKHIQLEFLNLKRRK